MRVDRNSVINSHDGSEEDVAIQSYSGQKDGDDLLGTAASHPIGLGHPGRQNPRISQLALPGKLPRLARRKDLFPCSLRHETKF